MSWVVRRVICWLLDLEPCVEPRCGRGRLRGSDRCEVHEGPAVLAAVLGA